MAFLNFWLLITLSSHCWLSFALAGDMLWRASPRVGALWEWYFACSSLLLSSYIVLYIVNLYYLTNFWPLEMRKKRKKNSTLNSLFVIHSFRGFLILFVKIPPHHHFFFAWTYFFGFGICGCFFGNYIPTGFSVHFHILPSWKTDTVVENRAQQTLSFRREIKISSKVCWTVGHA